MLTQRTFWATIAGAALITGLIGYELVRYADGIAVTSVPSDPSAKTENRSRGDNPIATPKDAPPPDGMSQSVSVPDPSLQKVGAPVGLQLRYALKAVQQSPPDYALAESSIANADAVANKTDLETLKINEVRLYLASKQRDYAKLALLYEHRLSTPRWRPFISKEEIAKIEQTIAKAAAASRDWVTSIQYSKRSLETSPNDVDMLTLLAWSHAQLREFDRCREAADTAVAATIDAKRSPTEPLLTYQFECARRGGESATAARALASICSLYPRSMHCDRRVVAAAPQPEAQNNN